MKHYPHVTQEALAPDDWPPRQLKTNTSLLGFLPPSLRVRTAHAYSGQAPSASAGASTRGGKGGSSGIVMDLNQTRDRAS